MNTTLNISNNGVRIAYKNEGKIKNATADKGGELASMYNEQVCLSNEFMQTITGLMNDMEFAYPADAEKIKEMMHRHFEASLQLLRNRINKVDRLKSSNIRQISFNALQNAGAIASGKKAEKTRAQWTEKWIEQSDFEKNDAHMQIFISSDNQHLSWVGEWINQTSLN